jgi:hypothetical protein
MNDITSYGQQGNEKKSDTRKRFHDASKIGSISSAHRRNFCARLYNVGGASAEHPSRKSLAP